jgi:hypothetical protein
LETYCLEGVSIHVFALLFNAAGDSATVRAATLIDHLSYYVRFHNEVFERRAEGIDRVTNANKTAEKTTFKALSSGKKG